jgi:acetylornithine deacetylase
MTTTPPVDAAGVDESGVDAAVVDAGAVDIRAIESLLIELVAIDSVNPDLVATGAGEANVGRHVAAWAAQRGLEVSVEPVVGDRANVIVVARGTGGGRSIMLNAHLDTVGVEGYTDPFVCTVTDARLTGRGVLDTKAGLAAALVIAQHAGAARLRGDVVVAAVIDEEYASLGTDALIAASPPRWRTDAAIVLEPTDLAVATDHRGFVWGSITVHGVAAHGSRPDLGVDAIAHASPILSGITALQAHLATTPCDLPTGPGSVHASLIAGGAELSSYPDTCRIDLERRTTMHEGPETFAAELHALAALAAPDVQTTVAVGASRGPLHVAHDEAIVVSIVSSGARHGLALTPTAASFWTDAALLSAAGIPSVVFGPGGHGIHSISEWIDRASLLTFASVLSETVQNWCK